MKNNHCVVDMGSLHSDLYLYIVYKVHVNKNELTLYTRFTSPKQKIKHLRMTNVTYTETDNIRYESSDLNMNTRLNKIGLVNSDSRLYCSYVSLIRDSRLKHLFFKFVLNVLKRRSDFTTNANNNKSLNQLAH